MSNTEYITEVSKKLGEPEWLFTWRKEHEANSEHLSRTLHYGIGIKGVLPLTEASFAETVEYHVDAGKAIELYTWKEAVTQEEIAPIVQGLMESPFFPKATNHWSGLGQALFSNGLVVYVQPSMSEDGVLEEEKLTLDTLVPKGTSSDIVIVIAKEGAKFSLTSALSGAGEGSIFARTLVVLTERDAHVRVIQKQTLTKGTTALVSSRGIVAGYSSCNWSEIFTGDVSIKSEKENILVGAGAYGDIREGVIASETARFDLYSSTKHTASHSTSTIRAAGVALGNSKTVSRGMIDMEHGVEKVNGGQEAKFFSFSPKAEVDAIPSLDIASNDVNCSHKLSVMHLRDSDTFYPKLRGLSDDESRALFLEGAFGDVFSGEENEAIMDEVRTLLSQTQFS